MIYYGIKKNNDFYGFYTEIVDLVKFVTLSNSEHMDIIGKANNCGKIIVPDDTGHPVLVDPPAPTEEEMKEQEINELKSFLAETDWYVIRFADTGEPIPEGIKNKRAEARKRISEIR